MQRVRSASVDVDGRFKSRINQGLLIFLGVEEGDAETDFEWMLQKIPLIRCFEDENGRMNRSLQDIGGEAMVISQFTLFGSLRKGSRPSFNRAADPVLAEDSYNRFVQRLSEILGRPVATGGFGRQMDIQAENDGPVTLILDTRRKDF